MRAYLIYTLLFAVCSAGVFFAFWIGNYSMIIKPDGYLQHYTALVKLRHLVKEFLATGSFSFWSWDTGIGADTIASYASVLFDSFAYIAAAFGEKYIDIGYTVAYLLRLYACGISFMVFAGYMKYDRWKRILGGICYAFSGWALGCMMQSFFLYIMILFPVLILGIEKVYRRESPVPLILSTFFTALFTVYLLYMSGIMAAVYCILRYFHYHREFRLKTFLKEMGRLLLFVLIALLMASVVFVPRFYALWNASKDSANNAAMFYTLKRHLLLGTSFFTDSDVFGNYSFTGVGILFTLLIPVFLKKENRKKTQVRMWLICLVILAVPVLCRVMNGFTYPTGRWMYAMAFFCIWSGLDVLELHMPSFRSAVKYWIFCILLIYAVFDFGLKLFTDYQKAALLVNGIMGVLFLLLLSSHIGERENQRKWMKKSGVLTALAVINLIVINQFRYSPACSDYLEDALKNGEFYSKIKKSVQRVGQEIEDEDFYRIYQLTGISNNNLMHVCVNENIYWGNRSIYCYLSTLDNSWHEYNKSLTNSAGYSQRVSVYGNDLRTRMDFLMGVKYFFGDKKLDENTLYDHEEKNCLAVGYGYDSRELLEDVEVLKNRYSIGLGTVYENVISREEFETLSPAQKEECLMQAAVLEGEDLDLLYGKQEDAAKEAKNNRQPAAEEQETDGKVQLLTASEIETDSCEAEYRLSAGDHCVLGENSFTVSSGEETAFTISLDEVKDCEIYVVFHGLERQVPSYEEQKSKALGENPGLLKRIRYDAANRGGLRLGDFKANLSTDTVTKRIVNYSGTNQAFSDVTDYCINMGYYETFEGDIRVLFETKGSYRYEDLQVLILPEGNYEEQAQALQDRKVDVQILEDNYVKGSVSAQKGGLLYLSILKTPGWEIRIDGEKAEQVYDANIAFTGVMLSPGEHVIELEYRPVGYRVCCILSVLGFFLFAAAAVYGKMSLS